MYKTWYLVPELYKHPMDKIIAIPKLTNRRPKLFLYKIQANAIYKYEDVLEMVIQDRLVYIDAFGIERFTDKAITAWL
jgi:hypothetical protein